MFNGADWVRLVGPAPLTAEQFAARARRAGELTGELAGELDFPDTYNTAVPTAEQFLTLAPATALSKTGPAFPNAWAAASRPHLTA